ncbi:carbohydrate-binding domain-containing protein [Cellulomonas sp. PhB143]|uniref:carbohydrate-binding domain-containing protein n=1 Tax=Cellulomonas sp. PhB143 TaxID=2485186 RepID=UPI000F9F9712|nr:carbohydrate-binding domain-containing protein [Cellulomonas sp. PhB143]ROS79061.1 uncharacterized protein DUF4353 [Cellulomonas sp. PhB143]
MRRTLPMIITSSAVAALLLAGCTSTDGDGSGAAGTSSGTSTSASETSAAASADPDTTAKQVLADDTAAHEVDAQWDTADEVAIALGDGSATVSADGDTSGVSVDGSTVTITAPGTYRVSGTLDDGQLTVASSAEGTVRIVLDGADITSATGSPFVVEDADDVVVVLADGSENHLADAKKYDDTSEDAPNAALYSTADLGITGTGALSVEGSAADGITSKDGLVIESGNVTVDAADDGIRGKDYLVVSGGTLDVTAGGDGLKSDDDEDEALGYVHLAGGTQKVTAGADGVQAQTDLVVTGGSLDVASGGGHAAELGDDDSAKGLKADVAVVVSGGDVGVDAADDAVHSGGIVTVTDGALTLASGDDGVHSDGGLWIADGDLTVSTSVEALEGAHITLAGGAVDVTASDDGVNASTGSGKTETAAGGAAGGGAPDGAPTDMPQPPDGGGRGGGGAPDGGGQGGGMPGGTVEDASLTITGGTLAVDADGDGLDSNGTMDVSGGTVVVQGPTNGGNGALDVNGSFAISGGELTAVGSSGMAVAPDADADQASIMATLDSAGAAGSTVQVLDASGDVVASFTAEKEFGSVVYSSPTIEDGAEYTVTVDGTAAGTATAGDYPASTMGGPGGGAGTATQSSADASTV